MNNDRQRKSLFNWCARRDCSALRASSLRDRRRFATASDLVCGQVVELGLLSAGSSNHDTELSEPAKGFQARNIMVRPERFDLGTSLISQ
jgi:hypothetical protein